MKWIPITDLPDDWSSLTHSGLQSLAEIWKEQRARLEATESYQSFLAKMRRKIAIETGIIERLYTIDRGVTRLLIEHGIDASLIQHGTTDKPASEVVTLVRDHEKAIDSVFDFVGSQRSLSVSFIKQLHQLLTRNQKYTKGMDQFGNMGQVELIRGDWKRFPNNPKRSDGVIHEYCPPEHVSSQMDQLIEWHHKHMELGVSPEIEAAWIHHRVTQIHPFQDGNGRVARNLASLVFLKFGWFPLVVLDDQHTEEDARKRYIKALEMADDGDLEPLVVIFAENQRKAFISSLSLSEEAITEKTSFKSVLDSAIDRIKKKQVIRLEEAIIQSHDKAVELFTTAETKLQDVEREISNALSRIMDNAFVRFDSADNTDERASFYRYQIIQIAKRFNYYANLSSYRSWVRLAIRTDGLQTEILVSFHALGHEPKGIMICSACAYRRLSSDEGDTTSIEDLQPLSQTPFEFTYQEDSATLEKRFTKWLDDVLVVGVDYWQKGI